MSGFISGINRKGAKCAKKCESTKDTKGHEDREEKEIETLGGATLW